MNYAVKQATICMFYTNWCPHSKRVMPLWQSLRFQYDGKIINNYKLKFNEYNFTDPRWSPDVELDPGIDVWRNPGPIVDQWMKEYNVMGFPTVRIRHDNKEIEYDSHAPLTLVTLKQFVQHELENNTD